MHISPLIFSSIQLLDPVLTGVIVWIAGIEGVPDLYTWIGGTVIIIGVGFITVGEYKRTHKEEVIDDSKKMIEMKGGSGENSLDSDDADTVLLSESFDEGSSLNDDPERDGHSQRLTGMSSQSIDLSTCVDEKKISSLSSTSFIHHLPSLSLWKGKQNQQEYSALSAVEDEGTIV